MESKREAVKKAWGIFQPFKKHFAVMFLLLAIAETFFLTSPYLIGRVLNAMQDQMPIRHVLILVGMTGLAQAFGLSLHYLRDRYEIKHIDFAITRHLTNKTLEKVLDLSIGQHRSQNSGITQSVVNKGQNALHQMTFLFFYNILPVCLTVLITCSMLLWFHLGVGLLVSGFLILYVYLSFTTNGRYYPKVRKIHDLNHKTNKHYIEILKHPTLVLLQSQERRVRREHGTRLDVVVTESQQVYGPFANNSWANFSITLVARISILLVGAFLVYYRGYGIGDFMTIWIWTSQALFQIGIINNIQRQWLNLWGEAKKYFSLLEVEPTVRVVANPIQPASFRGEIEFVNISFTYPEQSYIELEDDESAPLKKAKPVQRALTNLSFKIRAGERIAFVGESGSGKSSIINLLTRSYDPDEGQVLIDGHDLRLLDLKMFRQAMSVVEQKVVLFDDTLRYNILFGLNGRSKEVTEEDLERVARSACIDRFEHRLTNGWDTMIGENGIKLSGGECQRVGIARALIKQSSILILDEATSSLDGENESAIKEAIREASVGRTTILIAHRLSTVQDVDKIFVLNKGEIVDEGPHKDLYERSSTYRNLVSKQLISL